MQRLPPKARAYVITIWLLGLLAALGSSRFPAIGTQSASWEIALMALLGILAGRVKVRLTPRTVAEDIGSLSLSFALIFATLLRCGPAAAMLVGALSTLSSCLFPKRQPPHQVLFNLSMNVIGTFLVGWVFLGVNGGTLTLFAFHSFAAVMTSSLVFFLVNTGTVAVAIALSTGKDLGRLWTKTFLWTAPSYLAGAVAGMLAILLLGAHIAFVILCVTPVAYLIYFSYALSRRQSEEEHRRIQELQAHEAQLATALEREHLIAETLQRSLLSTGPGDALPGLSVATQYEPAWTGALIGGDFYDTMPLPDGRIALVVGDVTGKGLTAATHTAEVKYALRAFLHEHPTPGEALGLLNNFLAGAPTDRAEPTQSLVSVALAVLDTRTGQAVAGCAGAEPPLVLRASGEVEPVPVSGMPLGAVGDAAYETVPFRLEPGDRLLLATDGITEARVGWRFFGYDGLIRSAQFSRACDTEESMGRAIIADARRFTGGVLQDDVCLLLARRH